MEFWQLRTRYAYQAAVRSLRSFLFGDFFCADSRFGRILSWDLWGFGVQLHGRDPQATRSGSPKKKQKTHILKKKHFLTSKSIRLRGEFLEVFLVGCGALGCEYLKGLALMGLAAMLAALLCDIEHAGIVYSEGNSSPKPSHTPTKLGHALLNEKSCVFIVFDAPRGDSLDTDARCMQWPWWKADCHRYGSHRGLLSMLCFTSCQSDMFFSKKIVHLLFVVVVFLSGLLLLFFGHKTTSIIISPHFITHYRYPILIYIYI